MDITKVLERYLRSHRARNSRPQTVAWHQRAIGQFGDYLELPAIDDLRADDLRRWIESLQGRKLAQATVATYVRSVKAFSNWLVQEEYLPKDPFARVKQIKVDDVPKELFSHEEVERLLSVCSKRTQAGLRDRAIILLLYSTGMRASEALELTTASINHDQGIITIRRGKGGKYRVVPLSPTVGRALDRYIYHKRRKPKATDKLFLTDEVTPMRLNTLQLALQRHGRAAGVHANAHKLRHSCAVQYLRNGGRLEHLQKLLGHSTINMTLHYARLAGVDVVEDHMTVDLVRALKRRL